MHQVVHLDPEVPPDLQVQVLLQVVEGSSRRLVVEVEEVLEVYNKLMSMLVHNNLDILMDKLLKFLAFLKPNLYNKLKNKRLVVLSIRQNSGLSYKTLLIQFGKGIGTHIS